MKDALHDAIEELKRVDHQIYVSLKYTRTVDVIINILNRMVDCYTFVIEALLKRAKENKLLTEELPTSALEKSNLVKSIYKDDVAVQDNMELYMLLRKLLNAKNIEREQEYRRHVTMKTIIDGREEIVNIDIITNYYLFQKEFVHKVQKMLDIKTEDLARDDSLMY